MDRASRQRERLDHDYQAGRIDRATYLVLRDGIEADLRQARMLPWEIAGGTVAMILVLVIAVMILRIINGA